MGYGDGSVYEGEWSDDVRSGSGKYTGRKQNGTYAYEDRWRNDTANGFGTARYADGSMYVGEFRDGKFSGRRLRA